MTTKHGITSAPTLHVQCRNPDCPRPADTTITLPSVGDGVVGRPELLCVGCDQSLTIVEG